MKIHHTIESIRIEQEQEYENEQHEGRRRKRTIGFVPTMGALHAGHASLIQKARSENDIVYVSIFVNPTQFGPNEDYTRYPRTIEADLVTCQEHHVDHIFLPSDATILYPHQTNQAIITMKDSISWEEAMIRPGHFDGVLTVVNKLCHIIEPTTLYLGQKDIRQYYAIKAMIDDLFMKVTLCMVPTHREMDGLASSSRNVYLSPSQRSAACIIYQALNKAQQYYETIQKEQQQATAEVDHHPNETFAIDSVILRDMIRNTLQSEPLINEIQYIAIDDRRDMKPLDRVIISRRPPPVDGDIAVHDDDDDTSYGAIISVAVKMGSVRLIDNVILS